MGIIRPNGPIKGYVQPGKVKRPETNQVQSNNTQKVPVQKDLNSVVINDIPSPNQPSVEAKQNSDKLSVSDTKSETRPAAQSVPQTLLSETPPVAESESKGNETNWVLESVADTPYANDPSMEIVKRRYGTLNGAVSQLFTEPLLDAITTSDIKSGSQKLKNLASTANWAQKFKQDAAKLVDNGGYEAMLQRAMDAGKSKAEAETLLAGVLKSKSMRFQSDLPANRAKEADKLLQQFQNGNENPGIGSKALGKGISYLRGRKGTRIFYKKQGDETLWLAVCDKSTEPKAIRTLQKEFGLS